MTDRFSKEKRSKIMSQVKSVSRLEDEVCKALWKKGIRFRRNTKSLYGTPDISIKKYKVVIFIDSCFWHHCPIHGTIPESNKEFWVKKLMRNKEHDSKVTSFYREKGWSVLRIWEHEIREDFEKTINKAVEHINYAKKYKIVK